MRVDGKNLAMAIEDCLRGRQQRLLSEPCTGELHAAGAWQQALQILDELGLPDNLGVRARLEQARLPRPPA